MKLLSCKSEAWLEPKLFMILKRCLSVSATLLRVLCPLRRMFRLIAEDTRRSSSDLFGIYFYKKEKVGVKLAAAVEQAPDLVCASREFSSATISSSIEHGFRANMLFWWNCLIYISFSMPENYSHYIFIFCFRSEVLGWWNGSQGKELIAKKECLSSIPRTQTMEERRDSFSLWPLHRHWGTQTTTHKIYVNQYKNVSMKQEYSRILCTVAQNISDAWKTQMLEPLLRLPALLCGATLSSCTAWYSVQWKYGRLYWEMRGTGSEGTWVWIIYMCLQWHQ